VYKCGKRWKAQLQSQGVQFYLGTYDSELEAAKAYDRKALEEKGDRALTNFDYFGNETTVCQTRSSLKFLTATSSDKDDGFESGGGYENVNAPYSKRLRSHEQESCQPKTDPAAQLNLMWERLGQITNRLELSRAAHLKLCQLQHSKPDNEKESLITSLRDEIVLLEIVQSQLEESISHANAKEQECKQSYNNASTLHNNDSSSTRAWPLPHLGEEIPSHDNGSTSPALPSQSTVNPTNKQFTIQVAENHNEELQSQEAGIDEDGDDLIVSSAWSLLLSPGIVLSPWTQGSDEYRSSSSPIHSSSNGNINSAIAVTANDANSPNAQRYNGSNDSSNCTDGELRNTSTPPSMPSFRRREPATAVVYDPPLPLQTVKAISSAVVDGECR